MMDFIKDMIQIIKNRLQQAVQQRNQRQEMLHRQEEENRIQDLMYNMTYDLFEVFKDHSYSYMKPVRTPEDIRMFNFKKTGSSYIYRFSMEKNTPDLLSVTVARQLQEHMNQDIAATTRRLLYLWGIYMQMQHPFLCCGIYVTSIQNIGGTDIVISVQTHVRP